MKRKGSFVWLWMVLLALSFSACDSSEENVSVNVDSLVDGLGLGSNIFDSDPNHQLGTLIFYTSRRIVDQWAVRLEYVGDGEVVIQIQGELATDILDNIAYFSRGTIRSTPDSVVYLFGEIAEAVYDELRAMFTIDDLYYFEGKEMIVMGGSEAITMVDIVKQKFLEYASTPPRKIERVASVTYEEARTWTLDVVTTLYDDLSVLWVTNPFAVAPVTTYRNLRRVANDLSRFPLEGIGQVSLLTGHVWVISFDSLSHFFAFISGAERIPESVVLRKTIRGVGETGYLISYSVAQGFASLSGRGDPRGLWLNPWLAFNVVSEAIDLGTNVVDSVRAGATEITVGYISDNAELLGEFLELIHAEAIGDFFVFMGETLTSAVAVPSTAVGTVVRFTGHGLSAVVGLLSFNKPFEARLIELRLVWRTATQDLQTLWHEFLQFMGIR